MCVCVFSSNFLDTSDPVEASMTLMFWLHKTNLGQQQEAIQNQQYIHTLPRVIRQVRGRGGVKKGHETNISSSAASNIPQMLHI